jgi:hypothetical protein
MADTIALGVLFILSLGGTAALSDIAGYFEDCDLDFCNLGSGLIGIGWILTFLVSINNLFSLGVQPGLRTLRPSGRRVFADQSFSVLSSLKSFTPWCTTVARWLPGRHPSSRSCRMVLPEHQPRGSPIPDRPVASRLLLLLRGDLMRELRLVREINRGEVRLDYAPHSAFCVHDTISICNGPFLCLFRVKACSVGIVQGVFCACQTAHAA